MNRIVLCLSLLLACSDPSGDSSGDASMSSSCWPEVTKQIPHGSLTLGMGRGGFQPMPEIAPLEWGVQDGFMFVLSARMTGFRPGHPTDFTYEGNPFTRIRAYFDDTNVPLNRYTTCAFRNPYTATVDGDYVMNEEAPVMFETCWRIDRLVGQRIRIEGEILDTSGNYAAETHVVTAAAPLNPNYPMESSSAPCPP
jgi:hypothetical protein